MKKSSVSLIYRILSILSLFLLLTDPSLALEGAKNGLLLWGMVIVPTLFPFMLCSAAIVGSGGVPWLTRPFMPFFSRFLHLSENGSYVLLSGLLCGYPMGAKTCGEFYREGRISFSEARRLLAFTNHPSPMFLVGYAASQISAIPGNPLLCPVWRLLLCIYLPILPLAVLSGKIYGICPASEHKGEPASAPAGNPVSLDEAITSCAETMVKIGAYIMIFSIIVLYGAKIPFSNPVYRGILLSSIEITTGIQAVALTVSGPAGPLLITMASAFGGLSGIFQTKSVIGSSTTKNAGLSIRHYVLWKLLHGLSSGILFILSGFLAHFLC